MKMKISALTLALIGSANLAFAEMNQSQPMYSIFRPSTITWVEGSKALPPKLKMAVLAGDLTASGPFTVRLKLPAGYQIPAHSHPGLEQITVISGDFHIGSGDVLTTAKGETLNGGSFVALQPNMNHYAWSKHGAIIQLNSVGPWDIHYVDPKNDPRNKKP